MFRIGSLLVLFFLSLPAFSMKRESFFLKNEVRKPLISFLEQTVGLHEALYSKKKDQVNLIVSKMIKQIEELKASQKNLVHLSLHEKLYMDKWLGKLKIHLEAIKNSDQQRRINMNAINRALAYVAHLYELKQYAVFFCPQDQSIWMQTKEIKKEKLLHLNYESCGTMVGR